MSAAAFVRGAPEGSTRLLADVRALGNPVDEGARRVPALTRLEEALGREFADRLVAALSAEPRR